VIVGVVWEVCDLTTCESDITGEGVSVGFSIGASMGLSVGLELGFGVGISLDLLVFTAVEESGACDWEGSSQGAGALVPASCAGALA
jgi:hypothetical protein